MNFNNNNLNLKWAFAMLIAFQMCASSCKKDRFEETGYQPRPVTASSSKFISKIFEYVPAPGQFINEGLGNPEAAESLVGKANEGLVSLGGFGGYLIFGFDHSIKNGEGADIGIFGNPLTGVNAEWSEPGIVMVMQDLNNNGLPDDGPWFELAGSEYHKAETIKNYKITYYNPKNATDDIRWTDNQGKEGHVLRNRFHSKQYYPLWIKDQEQISFTGTLLKSTLFDGPIITSKPFEWGYSDSGSQDYKALMESTGKAYNSFDISWAVDDKGKPVVLDHIDFVKVYTGQNSNGNPYEPDRSNPRARYLGEVSTEVGGAIDISLYLKK
ncbi:MAG: PKD domain-containing protein [Candidatus Pedobacter colombiensis]|uniref:PKD domain-containing protein n=1 Tax=Candidatus Pedobacter colombiensis TaxID=3121371 RepID=A0AAJ6B8R8_9SPHI|nr:PKD domain-containing protein [Pedobacter sp.]WEK21169.1 MAG: PKD domain-containing protein [Pedobacter sp.]